MPFKQYAVIFPCEINSLNAVDSFFHEEWNAAANFFQIIFFDYDEFVENNILRLNKQFKEDTTCIYRGWMMKPGQYENFYNRLKERKLNLVTKPESYSLMHLFPNVYPYIKNDTPGILVYPDNAEIDLNEIKKRFQRFMVKDFVKSEKGTEFPPFFSADISEKDFNHWLEVFREYRGKLFTGGICIKEYIDLTKYNGSTNEWRAFYIGNVVVSLNPNSGQDSECPPPPEALVEKYKDFPSPFYTIDYGETAGGSWSILETGDGSVSGLCKSQSVPDFFESMKTALENNFYL